MAYLRQLAGGGLSHMPQPSPRLGDYGWSVRFGPSPPGHEPVTFLAMGPRRTINFTVGGRPGSRTLTTTEVNEIIRGNTDTDIKYLRAWRPGRYVWDLFAPSEQKHHSLRATYGQPQPAALAEIIADLRAQHGDILARPTDPW